MTASTLRRLALPLVVLVLAMAAGLTMLGGGSDAKTVTAHFPRTVSV